MSTKRIKVGRSGAKRHLANISRNNKNEEETTEDGELEIGSLKQRRKGMPENYLSLEGGCARCWEKKKKKVNGGEKKRVLKETERVEHEEQKATKGSKLKSEGPYLKEGKKVRATKEVWESRKKTSGRKTWAIYIKKGVGYGNSFRGLSPAKKNISPLPFSGRGKNTRSWKREQRKQTLAIPYSGNDVKTDRRQTGKHHKNRTVESNSSQIENGGAHTKFQR